MSETPEVALGAFQPKTKDLQLSPYTGYTRDTWLEAAAHMLDGAFAHVADAHEPLMFPKRELEVSYPHAWSQPRDYCAERFECLARTLLVAAHVMRENPAATANGIELKSYYHEQVLRACTPGDDLCVCTYDELIGQARDSGQVFQQTVECGLLAIGLWLSREQVFDTYNEAERRVILSFMRGYAEGNTVHQNWRLFNMLCLAFLHSAGEEIDESLMADLASAVLLDYAGDGWWRDGQLFDLYSVWSFSTFAPLWCLWYGRDMMPDLARAFEEASDALMENLPALFDRDGHMPMWGRSIPYRFAAVSAFAASRLLGSSHGDPGEERRISSGCLAQFFERDGFTRDGIPSLGFYGQFAHCVQPYSCAGSPFWAGLGFLCLALPKTHPFWSQPESLGAWEPLGSAVVEKTLEGPGLAITNHGATGASILRPGKVLLEKDKTRELWNYARLAFHTSYPWVASPRNDADAQAYVLSRGNKGEAIRMNALLWHGVRDGVLYRKALLGWDGRTEAHWTDSVILADIPMPLGILRADLPLLLDRKSHLTLGSYGMPDVNTMVERLERDGATALVVRGQAPDGSPRSMAMTIWGGWDAIDVVRSKHVSPESEETVTLVARLDRGPNEAGRIGPLLSQVITREDGKGFEEDELFPITSARPLHAGSFAPLTIKLADGRNIEAAYRAAAQSWEC